MPYSYLSCVLSLPATIEEWGDSRHALFLRLASDRGFTFLESRPLVSGTFNIPTLIAAIKPWISCEPEKSRGITLQRILQTENAYISEASRRFEDMYRHEKDKQDACPNILVTLEAHSGIPELFRKQMLLRFTSTDLDEEMQFLEEDAERMNRAYYREVSSGKAIFKEEAERKELSVEHNTLNEPVVFTLRQAIEDLNVICDDLLRERESAKETVMSLEISKEAMHRFQEQDAVLRRLEKLFAHVPKMIFDLQGRIHYQQHYPDGIQGDDALALTRAILSIEENGTNSDIILKDIPAQETFHPELEESVAGIFIQYYGPMESAASLHEIIRFALWSEMAVLDDDDEGESSVSYAPVITYLVFKRYHRSFKKSDLVKISLNAVFSGYQGSSMSEKTAIKDFYMYCDLCKAYQRHYAERHTTEIQSAWDMAFLHYSGYSRIFEYPNILRAVRQKVSFAVFEITNDIDAAVDINRIVDLSHSHVFNISHMLDRFHPMCETDLGWNAVRFFKNRLMKDERANGDDSYFARYVELIQQPYENASIREILECGICLLCGGKCGRSKLTSDLMKCNQCENKSNRFQDKNYADLFSCLHLEEIFTGSEQRASFQQGEIFAILEYTLRLLAAERCTARLYRWYYDLLCLTFEDVAHERG